MALALACLVGGCNDTVITPVGVSPSQLEFAPVDTFTFDGNPLFPGADPAAHVWPDGQMWIYPTDDQSDWNLLNHWDAWSSRDLHTWIAHRSIFSASQCSWCVNNAWAPDAAYRNGKYYFYYYFNNGYPLSGTDVDGIGVAVGDTPTGPFRNVTVDAPLIDGHDPAVFLDDDDQAYLFLGRWVYYLADDMVSIQHVDGHNRRAQLFFDQDPKGKWEATWMFKRDGLYYFAMSDDDYRRISYYTAPSPTGPFTWRGTILPTTKGQTVHCSIVRWQDRWILFYHQWSTANRGHRTIYAEWLTFAKDGTISPVSVSTQGIGRN